MWEDFQLLWQILIVIGGLVVFALILILILYLVLKRKAKQQEGQPVTSRDSNKWVNALGGFGNIGAVEAKGSRLIVGISDNTRINKDELHDLGVTSVIVSQEKVTLVLKEKAENIKNLLQ